MQCWVAFSDPLALPVLPGSLARGAGVFLFTCAGRKTSGGFATCAWQSWVFNVGSSEVYSLRRDLCKVGERLSILPTDTRAMAVKFVPGENNVGNGL